MKGAVNMPAEEALNNTESIIEEPDESDGKRELSTIKFPYTDLDDAIEVAKGVHSAGGSGCDWDQLAAELNLKATGGGFRLRVLSAKVFGLLTYEKRSVTLSPLGTRICDPQQEKVARAEAFLMVPLYKAVFDKFRGATLPPTNGLETAMVALGVSPKQKDKARQVFQRSANQAGFLAYGPDRLVAPTNKGSAEAGSTNGKEEHGEGSEKKKEKDDESKRDPLIEGLIKRLPEPNSPWPLDARRKWLQTACNAFDLIYTGSEDGGSLKIEVNKDSAK
jgi:hypothetical protein